MTLPLQCLTKSITVQCNGRFNLLRQSTPSPTLATVLTTRHIASLIVPCTTNSTTGSTCTSRIDGAVKSEVYQQQKNLPFNLTQKKALSNVSIRLFSSSLSSISESLPQSSALQIQLYQYRICPFCNRVKTILDYINNTRSISNDDGTNTKENDNVSGTSLLSVKNIEVNPLTKSEIKSFSKDYRKVPIATFDIVSSSTTTSDTHHHPSKTIFGSDEIIHHLLTEYPIIRKQLEQHWVQEQQQLLPSTSTSSSSSSSSNPLMTYDIFLNHDTAKLWTTYATNELAVWLYPNMCRTYRDSYTAFQYIHDPTLPYSTFQRYMIQYIGALAMTFAANKIKSTCDRSSHSSLFLHCRFHANNSSKTSTFWNLLYITFYFFSPSFLCAT
jgi:hypothetical protein